VLFNLRLLCNEAAFFFNFQSFFVMQKSKLIFLALIIIGAITSAYRAKPSPSIELQELFRAKLSEFETQLAGFKTQVGQQDFNQGDLQGEFLQLRLNFKELEPLLSYLSPQDFNDYLNGAPLPKVERNAPRLVVIEPKGLQILEEQIFASADEFDIKGVRKLTKELLFQYQQVQRSMQYVRISDRQVFEIMRLGLIRILSLGITGFDTPAGRTDMRESEASWLALGSLCEPYLAINTNQALSRNIKKLWQDGAQYLNSTSNFTDFNRADFIRLYLDPLYAKIYDLHMELGYEFAKEVYHGELAFNYEARSIFGQDFFNSAYFTGLLNTDQAAADLGKQLFFDPILSSNLKRSCASCHRPELAFTDGHSTSLAMDEKKHIKRNSPSLINAIYTEKFFYDLRADRMESQIDHVIFNPDEFANNYKTILQRLNTIPAYKEAFAQSFPEHNGQINRQSLAMALTAYLKELTAFNSPVDRYLRGEEQVISAQVKQGFNLFMGKANCGTCHFAPSFSGLVPPMFEESESEVLGLLQGPDQLVLDEDLGRYASGIPSYAAEFYRHSFKTVSVRNVKYTAPYFHHGGYATLAEVIEFYERGGGAGQGLDVQDQTLSSEPLGLSSSEKEALISFMEALSDTSNTSSLPTSLAKSTNPNLNFRKVGGEY
jgi:cytochrome c peroxidase